MTSLKNKVPNSLHTSQTPLDEVHRPHFKDLLFIIFLYKIILLTKNDMVKIKNSVPFEQYIPDLT